ncbi:MFS transporter [archaeon]|jgi:MFS family permease|nr:MFS transporter [archaeon]MBT4396663.1 MFS transporter [archaeon]MBT4441273.1 MFS transporter [archaeon]
MDIAREYHLKSLFTRELFEIYFLLITRALSFSMIGIFIPLYLFVELSYSLNWVIYYYLAFILSFFLFQYIATFVIMRFGAKHSMITGVFFTIGMIFLIYFLRDYSFLFFPAAIFYGIQGAFFWMGFHIDAVLKGRKRDFGKESAIIETGLILPSIIGPIVGGLLIKFFGFGALYGVAICILIVSFIPLLFSKEVYAREKLNLKSFFDKDHLKYFFIYFAQGIGFISGHVFWTLFIFAVIGGYLSMGVYGSVATLLVCLITLFIGKVVDEGKKSKFVVRLGTGFNILFWILKIFVSNIFQVFAVGTLRSAASHVIDVPFLAKTYSTAKGHKAISHILFRETCLRIGQIFCLVLVLIIGKIESSFIISAIASVAFFFF